MSYSDGTTPNVAYAYDLEGNRTSMADGTGTTSYTYDELGQILTVSSPASPAAKVVGYRYDLDGERTKLIYPDGSWVAYEFDKDGRMVSVTDWANRVTRYAYLPDGSVSSVQNANGTSTIYRYDNVGRLTQVWNLSGANTISQHTYTLDSAGNRTRLQEIRPRIGIPRPIGVLTPVTLDYSYDRMYCVNGGGWSRREYYVCLRFGGQPIEQDAERRQDDLCL